MKLRLSTRFVLLFWAIAIMTGCHRNTARLDEFTEDVYTPQYATGFTITGAPDRESVIITTTNPWQGADSIVSRLFIARGGEQAPDGFDGKVINGNAKRIVTMSSTHVAMLDALGLASDIVGVSGIGFISNPYIAAHSDEVAEVGYDSNFNYEALVAADPDLVLLYGIDTASPIETKLDELNIPYMYIGDYLEESPLGKAEWVMALAEVTGDAAHGHEVWDSIPARYLALRQLVADSIKSRPAVMLNTPYRDSWFMPPVGSYLVTLITDAGGDYIYKENTSNTSVPVDTEQALLLTSQADFWLNTGSANTIAELEAACPKMAATGCVTRGDVYNNTLRLNANGGNDFYESGIMHPDLILRDLVKIFHPELVADEPFTYYTKLK